MKIKPGTCERCVFGRGTHSLDCIYVQRAMKDFEPPAVALDFARLFERNSPAPFTLTLRVPNRVKYRLR